MKRVLFSSALVLALACSALSAQAGLQPPSGVATTTAPYIQPFDLTAVKLQHAYESLYFHIDRVYVDKNKLPADWQSWRHKFDGKLHDTQQLTDALNALITHVGDPQIRLLSAEEVAVRQAQERGGWLGFGVESKLIAVYGETGIIQAHNLDSLGVAQGLQDQDILVAIDHQSLNGLGDWELFAIVDGADEVTFTVKRSGKTLDVVLHPDHSGGNFGLGIGISPLKAHEEPHLFSNAIGPAALAGLAESEILLEVNGKSASMMGPSQLKALSSPCHLGDTLRVRVQRVPGREFVIPCGLVPYNDHNLRGTGGSGGGDPERWQMDTVNLDDPRLPSWLDGFTAEYTNKTDLRVFLDLRDTVGTNVRQAAKVASYFIRNGAFACEDGDWRNGSVVCTTIIDGTVTEDYDSRSRPLFPQTQQIGTQIAVLINDSTSGTALLLAAALQAKGATVFTTGNANRSFEAAMTTSTLEGDPLARSFLLPEWRAALTNGGAGGFTADKVVPADQAHDIIGKFLGLSYGPYNQRQYD